MLQYYPANSHLLYIDFLAIHEDGTVTVESEAVKPQTAKLAKPEYYAKKWGYKKVIISTDTKLLADLKEYLLTLKEGKQ